MKHTLLIIFCLAPLLLLAQSDYDVANIPAGLRSRANAIIRNQTDRIVMSAPDQVVHTVKKAVTVMNANGENHGRLVLHYDKSTTIKSIKGEVYNEVGISIGKFNEHSFRDESAVQDFSMFEDSRVKHFLPTVTNYPYTVVYEYEVRNHQNLIIPEWFPKRASDLAVEKSSLVFSCKPEDQLRLDIKNVAPATVAVTDKQKTLTWTVANIPANKNEPFSPSLYDYFPRVKIAPEHFSYFGRQGNYTDWKTLGKWVYDDLVKDRQQLPPATLATVQELTKNAATPKEKAKLLYDYLQQKTRYISVQVGIGGFMPFKATDVDRTSYGDCKALVNYMQSLLKAADIPSYYCVVEAGKQKIGMKPHFASMDQGNHIILCLPFANDTTWLECTNQKIPFGFLGDFTDDRLVLACTEDGGKLLHTPKYDTNNSLQIRKGLLRFDEMGNLTGTLTTDFSGGQYENHEYIVYQSPVDREKSLKKVYDVDHIDFEQINYVQTKTVAPRIEERIKLSIRQFGTLTEARFYVVPNAFNQQFNIDETSNRQFPVQVARGFTDIDSISYTLPGNVLPLLQPITKEVSGKFGNYHLTISTKGDQLLLYRKMVLHDGTYPPEDFTAFAEFMNATARQDRTKVYLNLKK